MASRHKPPSVCWLRQHASWRRLALRARSAPMAWALRARAPACCPPPITARARALSLGGGDVEDVVRFALLETLGARRASRSCRGGGWGGVVQTSSSASVRGTLVCCRSMCSARRRGAPLGSERLPPRPGRSPALSARVLQRFALERCGQVGAARRRHSRVRPIMPVRAGSPQPPWRGGLQESNRYSTG